jgi:hypothetical protein
MSVERIEIPADPEVFVEWQAQGVSSDDGKTLRELRELWNCGERIAKLRLHAANKAGVLRTGHRQALDITGRNCRIPVYWLEMEKKRRRRG